jgi:hypothetical protein
VIAGFLLSAALLAPQQDSERWTMSGRFEPRRFDGDSIIQLVENPVFTSGNRTLRASWLVIWLDKKQLADLDSDAGDQFDETKSSISRELDSFAANDFISPPSLFSRFKSSSLTSVAQEIYLEGPIEYLVDGKHVGQAGAVYLDMVDGHGWIAEAAISVKRSIRGRVTHLRVLADWLRHSADGSIRADDAVVTSCGFDSPHYHLSTKDLRITPSDNKESEDDVLFDVTLRTNRLKLSESISIPLPKLSYPAGTDFTPKYEGFRLGNSARFGNFAEAQVNGDIGKLGERLTSALGNKSVWPKGKARLKLRWLGSRGVLLDSYVKFREDGRYAFELAVGGLPDRGDDRGAIRVGEDLRDTARLWYRSRGRFNASPTEWYDVSFSSQSDPGVQSEFWERRFFSYEHRDTYLHYRNAKNEYYFDATALARVDSYRTEVNEAPEIGFTRFSSEVAKIGSQSILYSTRTTAANLRRVEGGGVIPPVGTTAVEDGLELNFEDGFGDRQVKRIDTMHRIELPFSLPFGALRATPFTEVQATLWDRGEDPANTPTRVGSFVGLRLASNFWKRRAGGGLHVLTPSLEAKSALSVRNDNGTPVRFDVTEDNIDANQYELGLRSRWLEDDGLDEFDVDLKSTYQSSVPGERDRWLPLEMYSGFFSNIGDVKYGMRHEALYDFDRSQTAYSATALGFDISRNWGVELGHQRGRDESGEAVFESAGIGTRFKWTPKWEFDGRVSFSILDDGEDFTQFIVRRVGHDFVFELEFEDRTGEGGSSIGFSFRPIFNWRPGHLGALRR